MNLLGGFVGAPSSAAELPEFKLACEAELRPAKMATHSSVLAWRIPWTEEPVYLILDFIAQKYSLFFFFSLFFY